MKWQHWLGWALLAVCVVVLGVYVFGDKPVEAKEVVRQEVRVEETYRCSAQASVHSSPDVLLFLVTCPVMDSSGKEVSAVVSLVTPQLQVQEQWSGRLRRNH